MKKMILTSIMIAMTIILGSFYDVSRLIKLPGNSNVFGREISGIILHMKTYTLAIAGQMPEDKYDFKPIAVDTVRTFAEQLKHIAISIENQTNNILEGKTFNPVDVLQELNAFEKRKMTKQEIIDRLSVSFDKLSAKLASMTDEDFDKKYSLPFSRSGPQSYRVLSMFIRDHITHHRAQALVYLRMNNIAPAFYSPF